MLQAALQRVQRDELFVHAKRIRDIGYLAWMADMICEEGPEAIEQAELDWAMASVVRVLR